MVDVRPVSQEERDEITAFYRKCPRLDKVLPLTSPCTTVIQDLDCECPSCNKPIPAGAVAVDVTRPLPTVLSVNAIGVCPDCRLMTRFLMRFRQDGSWDSLRGKNWVRGQFECPDPAWWDLVGWWNRWRG